MFKSFTWQDFLLAATLLTLIWYGLVWLCFRKKGKPVSPALQHRWEEDFSQVEDRDGLMGKPALEHGVSVVEADDFSFAPVERAERADRVGMLGELADVQQEIRTACSILASEDGTKEDFFTLFEVIRGKYPKLASSPLLPELNGFIREQVPFYLSEEELEQLWD